MVQNGAGSDMETFENKRKQLFACLDQAEKELKGPLNQSARPKRRHSNEKEITPSNLDIKKFRGKESIFKKPELPLTKCLRPRVTPDYQVNPHKWKKYSLSDVDISDRTNTSAAFAFLREIEAQKEKICEDDAIDEGNGVKPVFNKSLCVKKDLPEETAPVEEQPKLKGAVLVMPEYTVGQKASKAKKKVSTTRSVAAVKQLTLSHLMDEEDEEDD